MAKTTNATGTENTGGNLTLAITGQLTQSQRTIDAKNITIELLT